MAWCKVKYKLMYVCMHVCRFEHAPVKPAYNIACCRLLK